MSLRSSGCSGKEIVYVLSSWDFAFVGIEFVVHEVRVLFEGVRLSVQELAHFLEP